MTARPYLRPPSGLHDSRFDAIAAELGYTEDPDVAGLLRRRGADHFRSADGVGRTAPVPRHNNTSAPFYGLDVPQAQLELVADLTGFTPTVLAAFVRLDSTTTAAVVKRIGGAGLVQFVTLEPWPTGAVTDRPDAADSLASIVAGTHDLELLGHVHHLFAQRPGLTLWWVFSPVGLDNTRAQHDLGALYPGDDAVAGPRS